MEEFEIKFLEVDVPKLEKKLLEIGAKKVGEFDYSRAIFDYPDFRLDKMHAWIRLRTDGKEATLTYKERIGVKSSDGSIADDGMKEIEVGVGDYEKTSMLLKAMGFVIKIEVKNKRIRYVKGDSVFDIDFYPNVPAFIEIESDSLEKAQSAATELGFDPAQGLMCSPKQIFIRYGIELDDYSSMTFEGMIKK